MQGSIVYHNNGMKVKVLLVLLFSFFSTISKAQNKAPQSSLTSIYFQKGMLATSRYYDSCLLRIIQDRKNGRLSEVDFISRYRQTESRYRAQVDTIARVANSLAKTPTALAGKLVAQSLSLVRKGNLKQARQVLLQAVSTMSEKDKAYAAEILLLCADSLGAQFVLPNALKDSLAGLNKNRFPSFDGKDTLLFIAQKVHIAYLFAGDSSKEAAIGTLLEAQKWAQDLPETDTQNSLTKAQIAFQLSQWQLDKTDFKGAFNNVREAIRIYEALNTPAFLFHQTLAKQQLAKVYLIAGAHRESDTIYQAALSLYEQLSGQFPEYYSFSHARALVEYAQVKRYFDQYQVYDSLLLQSIPLWAVAGKSNPFALLEMARTYNALGTKKMNVDVKLTPAMEYWNKSKIVLDSLSKKLPYMSIAYEYSDALYRLGAGNFALKQYKEALPLFARSMEMRLQLFELAPEENRKELIDVLVQNGTVNIREGNKDIANQQLDQAIKMAEESGESDRVRELQKFKNEVVNRP